MYKDFRDMTVWRESMKVAEIVFASTDNLPRKEDYGFTSQIRRSALSISANIAEAFGREHANEKIHFYYYSRGSLTETQSHLEYGKRVGYFQNHETNEIEKLLENIHFELNKIIKTLKNR